MPIRDFLLRCLLALALVAGGVPTLGMANDAAADPQVAATTDCHDVAGTDVLADDPASEAGCCGSLNCLCDCLHHMPATAPAVWKLYTPVFPATAPAPRTFVRISGRPSATLRPPIA